MVYREAIGSLYTFGYGLFRIYFLAIGDYLVQQGLIDSRFDIFYLHLSEIRSSLQGPGTQVGLRDSIAERKRRMDEYRDVILPEVIYGDTQPPAKRSQEEAQVLRGTATSRGYYKGPVKVARGIEDLPRIEEGDVLVVPYSDVGWTPLFGKAGAVVAESGGMLSHSSVIAREYGIPAVVSVHGACQLPEGTVVTVDGYRGLVEVET
jgi:pyruvate,water dikinase